MTIESDEEEIITKKKLKHTYKGTEKPTARKKRSDAAFVKSRTDGSRERPHRGNQGGMPGLTVKGVVRRQTACNLKSCKLRTPGKREGGGNEHILPRQPRRRVQVAREGCREEKVTEDPNRVKKGKVVSWQGEMVQYGRRWQPNGELTVMSLDTNQAHSHVLSGLESCRVHDAWRVTRRVKANHITSRKASRVTASDATDDAVHQSYCPSLAQSVRVLQ